MTDITEGDTVTLTVPDQAVGLAHANIESGIFTVEGIIENADETRLHVTPEDRDAPRFALRPQHVTQVS